MLKFENLLKGLRAKHANECKKLIKEHDKIRVWMSPGHVFLCYGNERLDNVQSFDTVSGKDAFFAHQQKVKKSYLKLKNLQHSIVDLVFPSCCMSPILWVVLENGIVFIWTFNRSTAKGPRWVPTGQFFITDTSDLQTTISAVLMHKRSNTFLWVETSNEGSSYNVKKMSLPSDVTNINYESDPSNATTILQNSPKCSLHCVSESVFMIFSEPCPPGIVCSWQYPNRINLFVENVGENSFDCIWKSNSTYELNNFPIMAMKLSRHWINRKQNDHRQLFTLVEQNNAPAILVTTTGAVFKLSGTGSLQKLFAIDNFARKRVEFCFVHLDMFCCVQRNQMTVFNLENGEKIDCLDIFYPVKTIFSHNCCIKCAGVVLQEGNALKICINNPTTLFKSNSEQASPLLGLAGQEFLEFLARLHQLVIKGNVSKLNVDFIVRRLLSDRSVQSESILCLVEQIVKKEDPGQSVDFGRQFDEPCEVTPTDHNQATLIDFYRQIDRVAQKFVDDCIESRKTTRKTRSENSNV